MLFLLPVVSGFLLFASFPRVDQGYLAWIAFVPVAVFIGKANGIRHALGGGFVLGFIQAFLMMTWMPIVLMNYGGLSTGLAWLAYSLLIAVLACFPAAVCGLTKCLILRGGDAFLLIYPALWVLSEYAQSLSPFGGLPWLTVGYSQSRFLPVIQVADVTGVYGISFVIVWTAVSIVWIFNKNGRGTVAWLPAVLSAVMVVGMVCYGAVELHRWGAVIPRFRTAMLQKNISYDDPHSVLMDKFLNGYVRMADSIKPGEIDLLLLPESPSPVFFETDARYRQILQTLAGRFRLGIIFNNVRYLDAGEESRFYNTAYFMNRGGSLVGFYDKIHLVPFGEYIPLKRLLSFIDVISKDAGSFEFGSDYRLIKLDGHAVNAVICFEAVFPGMVRKFIQQGSEMIVNLTNDGWYGRSAAPYQHLSIVRLRAVEYRRFLLRSTNSGVSAVINPDGRIQASTEILREQVCEGKFDFIASKTLYARYGDVFVLLCAIISVGSALFAGLCRVGIYKRLT
jgi:apolipoprotein N-acyltransferase